MKIRWLLILVITSCLDLFFIAGFGHLLPDTEKLATGVLVERTSGNGEKFKFMAGPKNSDYVRFGEISQHLKSAVLILEDSRFYQHAGFDPHEIKNALSSAIRKGKRLRGASTISQQLVKNMYLTAERSFKRKFIEALITIKLENTLSKSKILELYLNSIDWGRGQLGIKQASQYYFKKLPKDLNLLESVYLASIIPNPARFGQEIKTETILDEYARTRMMNALETLYRTDRITLQQYEKVLWDLIED